MKPQRRMSNHPGCNANELIPRLGGDIKATWRASLKPSWRHERETAVGRRRERRGRRDVDGRCGPWRLRDNALPPSLASAHTGLVHWAIVRRPSTYGGIPPRVIPGLFWLTPLLRKTEDPERIPISEFQEFNQACLSPPPPLPRSLWRGCCQDKVHLVPTVSSPGRRWWTDHRAGALLASS